MLKKVLPLAMLAMMFLGLFNLPTFASPIATFYVDATKTTDLELDEEFWVIIKFKDFEQLWMWQAGLQWDPDKLECLEVVAFKPFYPESVFAVLAPTRSTAFIDGTIDNTAGKIYPPYAESLKAPGEGVTGAAGVGYPVLKARFKVEAYFPEGTTLTPLETAWTAYPNVGTFLPHEAQPLTIYSKAPPAPYGPTAKFTWTPVFPTEGETVTFDGSTSKGGFDGTSSRPITEFRWDFDGDMVWDTWGPPDTHKIVTHVYTAGDYNVTLEVFAPGAVPETDNITKTIKVLPPAMGAQIDLYCQKVPFDGKGPNVESDAFAPQELVILYAKVTYNGDPVADKLVAFQVNSSDGQAVLFRVDDTDSNGIATVEFRIPSKPPFGTWLAWATVDVAQTTVADTMPFKVGWIIEILSVTPGADSYKKGETATFDLSITNIAKTSKTPTITVVVYDAVGVPIGWVLIPEWYIEGEATEVPLTVTIDIPLTAFKSPPSAMVFANAFTDLPSNNGVPYCPEASNSFLIESP